MILSAASVDPSCYCGSFTRRFYRPYRVPADVCVPASIMRRRIERSLLPDDLLKGEQLLLLVLGYLKDGKGSSTHLPAQDFESSVPPATLQAQFRLH